MQNTIIAGKNPVMEALKSGRSINKIMVIKGKTGGLNRHLSLASKKKIPIQTVSASKLDELSPERNHQGIIAEVATKDYVDFDEMLNASKKSTEPFLILLDGLEDPRNLGAIMRTAEAVACHGIIIPKRRSVSLNQTVAKTSAGAIEYVPVSRVPNLVMAMEKLKKEGFWIVGCEASANENIYDLNLKGPIAVVIGSEGKGLNRLVAENCDFLAKIPMKGKLNSLNASVAASIVMYEVLRQRQGCYKS
ncbi:MAG: rlmB [Clostridiales bacterium]|jgi:23S rRNA (guanosine2251-2'-O)-methyltransferase|nr:rlmB [Clostridiales bacterium]